MRLTKDATNSEIWSSFYLIHLELGKKGNLIPTLFPKHIKKGIISWTMLSPKLYWASHLAPELSRVGYGSQNNKVQEPKRIIAICKSDFIKSLNFNYKIDRVWFKKIGMDL